MAVKMPSLHSQQMFGGVLPTYVSTHSSRLHQDFDKEMENGEKGILPPNIKNILKSRYPLPCAEPESSGDDEIELFSRSTDR